MIDADDGSGHQLHLGESLVWHPVKVQGGDMLAADLLNGVVLRVDFDATLNHFVFVPGYCVKLITGDMDFNTLRVRTK